MIKKICLQNFRNHGGTEFSLDDSVVFVGQNAVGKTNLLEAIHVGVNGFGFRGNDEDLVQNDKDWARVDLETSESKQTVKLQFGPNGRIDKTLELDGVKKSPRSFRNNTSTVLFEPSILRMLSGPPELRRAWLDGLLTQLEPTYEDSLKRYKRALFQRNSLLKRSPSDDELFVWELKLGEYGEQIVKARVTFFSEIDKSLESLYSSISKRNDRISVDYSVPAESYSSWLVGKLQTERERDKIIGFTRTGPHRDDFIIQQNDTVLSSVGSRGEIRSMVLALKLHELRELEKRLGSKPVLLLDDVFSELDVERRKSLLETTRNYQSFFTTTDVPDFIDENIKIIKLAT